MPLSWPVPADPHAAQILAERLAAGGTGGQRLVSDPAGAAMCAAIGGNSPYLADLAAREVRTLRAFTLFGPDAVIKCIMARLTAANPAAPRPEIARIVREAKRRAALVIALADIGGIWPLARITAALSDLAEQCLDLCVSHLLRAAHDRGRLRLPDPAHPWQGSGFAVLGMGKLGARELNYSSDVDLILLYDPDLYPAPDRNALSEVFNHIARDLVTLLERRDANGYVFRVDLRLRPDPGATPPAISLPAAVTYYESMGQNWERAAMIKARPLAGDRLAGQRFLDQIKPFIWRRLLDFAAINDIAIMKRRIDSHKGTALGRGPDLVSRLLGHDVKLGEGGIREIEFMAQTLQLVWGGRDPGLRARETVVSLEKLAANGHIKRVVAEQLIESYGFLRRVEHRIQMTLDRQTHKLPATGQGFSGLAGFLGFNGAESFAASLLVHLDRVRDSHVALFERIAPDSMPDVAPDPLDDAIDEALAIRPGDGAATNAAALLADLGYTDPGRIVNTAAGWRAGHARALRSERARALLDLLRSAILRALARQPDPDQAFARFDRLLTTLPSGVQILSLFQRNPLLIDRLATVLGAAPTLADHLARVPAAIEGLLASEEIDPNPAANLATQLADATLLEDHIVIIRRFVRGEEFRLSLATIEGRIDVDEAAFARTALADAAIGSLLAPVLADHQRRFGDIPSGGFAVVALGKAGGREMLPRSDLDLMLIYDYDPAAKESSGPKSLAPAPYFNRLAQGFVAAMTAPDHEGPLYAVDTRLRPSGNKGPVAVSLSAFRRYHELEAWTWERMALTRARIIAGAPTLTAKLQASLAAALTTPQDPAKLRHDATHMRARIARDLPPHGIWDVKLRAGGLIEVEFIAQVLQLIHAPMNPDLLAQNTCDALARLADAGLLAGEDAALLTRADRAWRTIQGLIRLMVAGKSPATLTAPARAALARDLVPDLEPFISYLATEVRSTFIRLIGNPEEITL